MKTTKMLNQMQWLILLIAAALALQVRGEGVRLPDQPPKEETEGRSLNFGSDDRGRSPQAQGRGLLDWLGLGEDQDPYIQQATQQCINGDLADCFKAQALRSFDDFFDKQAYQLSENAVLVKVDSQARALAHEPPTLSSQPRSEDSDWDALVKYGMRKIERFLRSTALEFNLDDDVTSNGVIAPKFLDGIADEVDIIEDKRAPPFRRHKLKKLIIPMLLILKLFKLKLLLFLPLILGLASFKKFLGFLGLNCSRRHWLLQILQAHDLSVLAQPLQQTAVYSSWYRPGPVRRPSFNTIRALRWIRSQIWLRWHIIQGTRYKPTGPSISGLGIQKQER
ncbi:hypothetical protein ACJJTC_014312 [Scirpophaga incertulas]